jgi:hypothetical protein
MINPISSATQGTGGAAPMHEAVLRFGATQEMREQQREERVATDEKAEAPVDQALIECADELAEGSQAPPTQSGGGAIEHAHGHAKAADENAIGGQGTGHDGASLEQQQESAIANHAVGEQGKRELVRGDAERVTRSTREMMGRIERAGGAESASRGEARSESSESAASAPTSQARSGEEAGPSDGGGEAASASGGGGGASAPSPGPSGGAAPRVGGDVIAAAVGSGVAPHEEISHAIRDEDDNAAQDADSSQESVNARAEAQGKRVGRDRPLEGGMGDFHEGEGGERESEHQRHFGGDRRPPSQGGQQGGQQDGRPAPERRRLELVPRETSLEAAGETAQETDARHAAGEAAAELAPADVRQAALEQSPPPQTAMAGEPVDRPSEPQPPTAESFERTAVLSPGLDTLGGDEYFFFDDVRLPEPPAQAS